MYFAPSYTGISLVTSPYGRFTLSERAIVATSAFRASRTGFLTHTTTRLLHNFIILQADASCRQRQLCLTISPCSRQQVIHGLPSVFVVSQDHRRIFCRSTPYAAIVCPGNRSLPASHLHGRIGHAHQFALADQGCREIHNSFPAATFHRILQHMGSLLTNDTNWLQEEGTTKQ